MEKLKKSKGFDYKYVIIGVCALMIFVGLGFCSSSKGIYLNPILEYTGISAGLYGFSDSFRYATTAIVNIFFGTLIAKFGVKKLVGAGFLSLALSMVLYSVSTTVVGFYLAGAFLGLGLAWTTTTMMGYIIRRWVHKNRGTVMGFILATNGLGGAFATTLFSPIIQSSLTGYKTAYLIVALIVFILGVIAVVFIKDNKTDAVQTSENNPKKKRGDSWIGIESKVAFKKKYFYWAIFCIFLTGLVIQSITGVFIRHIQKVEVSQDFQNIIIPSQMIILTFTKFLTGFMYDKFGLRVTISVNIVCSIIAMVAIALVDTTLTGQVLCVLYVITANIALPLETIMLPIYAGDLFGEKDYNKMLGYIVSANTIGYALGSPIMGFIFDIFGSYVPAFFGGAVIMATVLVVMQFVISSANKLKREISN